jgi:hypothetical protein
MRKAFGCERLMRLAVDDAVCRAANFANRCQRQKCLRADVLITRSILTTRDGGAA